MMLLNMLHKHAARLTRVASRLSLRTSSLTRQAFRRARVLMTALGLALFLLGWEALVRWQDYAPYVLPGPGLVWRKFAIVLADGTLLWHSTITLGEVVAGLALGVGVAILLGYAIAKSHLLDQLLSPYLVALQAVPIVALAPLLIIWVGFGAWSKILVCALTVFFPMLINTGVGIRSVEPDLVALMRSLRASRWQMFTLLEVPSALPVLLAGLKVSVTLAVIGAVVGEFVGADRGLGFLVNLGRNLLDTPLMFVALLTLVALALCLYGLVSLLERWLLRWMKDEG
ncbi:MAG: ABC transporter permease [Anaerolineae bacterium]